jgi:hypothetical protein
MARKKDKEHWSDGKPVSKHRVGIGSLFAPHGWLFFLLAALTGGITVMMGVIETNESPWTARIGMLVCGPLTAALLVTPIVMYVRMVKSVDLFDEGVVWDGTEVAAWEEITEYYRYEFFYRGEPSYRDITIETEDGRRVVFGIGLSNWEKLADRMQEETYAAQWPLAQEKFEAGEEVEFGNYISVGPEGITLRGDTIPWKKVKRVTVNGGSVCVFEKGAEESRDIEVRYVPNYGVLLRLVNLTLAQR